MRQSQRHTNVYYMHSVCSNCYNIMGLHIDKDSQNHKSEYYSDVFLSALKKTDFGH